MSSIYIAHLCPCKTGRNPVPPGPENISILFLFAVWLDAGGLGAYHERVSYEYRRWRNVDGTAIGSYLSGDEVPRSRDMATDAFRAR